MHSLQTEQFVPHDNQAVKWISVVGARPQFIKLAPLKRQIEAYNKLGLHPRIEHCVIHTGQHYDYEMSDMIMQQLGIERPQYNLEVGSGSHAQQLARTLERLEPVLSHEQPGWVIVYGDTNSALAGALAAARLGLRLAHVEAGCRSYNAKMPEEQNRVLIDHLSQLLLAPSQSSVENLKREGIGAADDPHDRRVVFVGDVMLDAFLANQDHVEALAPALLEKLGMQSAKYYVLTLHRAENTAEASQVRRVMEVLEKIDLPVLFPVHPRTRALLASVVGSKTNGNIHMIPPLGYLEMLAASKNARKIITDSGGVQKEAFYLRVPCVTLRETTEWPETVAAGVNCLARADTDELQDALRKPSRSFSEIESPFGDGNSSKIIVNELLTASSGAV
jgi:UDP-GlcNAc3NAcA epimerase